MISRTSAERVLNAALATGGDFAELYMEDGESHSISMLDGVVENAAYSRCPSRIYATATTGAGYHSRRWTTQSGCTC